MEKLRTGFAVMDKAEVARIAGMGGRAAHAMGRAHKFTREEAQRAGRIGGSRISEDRAHMSRIGSLGGAVIAARAGHMARIGSAGGTKVSQDREHMAELGRKGGVSKRA